MSGFLDKIKGGAEKASFEADRLRRLNQAQSTLKTMQREMDSKTAALGRQTLTLFDAGSLAQPELLKTCQKELDPLRQRIADQEAKIEGIRQERPPEAATPVLHGHICPRCQIQLPAEAGFCPRCGSQAVDAAPPPPATGGKCLQCGAKLTSGSLFCSNCGAPAPALAPPSMRICPACQTSIPTEAVFCPNCGTSISPSMPEIPLTAKAAIVSDKVVCPICHASIPTEAVFCPECGSAITAPVAELAGEETRPEGKETVDRITCPDCHASIPTEAVFCPECGTSVELPRVEAAEAEASSDEDGGSAGEQIRPLPKAEEMEDLPGEEKAAAPTPCPFCQALIPAEAVFCPECGEPIASISTKTE